MFLLNKSKEQTQADLEKYTAKIRDKILAMNERKFEKLIIEQHFPKKMMLEFLAYLILFNKLDANLERLYRRIEELPRKVGANEKKNTSHNFSSLVKSKNDLESLISKIEGHLSIEDKALFTHINNIIDLRDRIAHAIPIKVKKEPIVLFFSYDAAFWARTYRSARTPENKGFNGANDLKRKTLDDNSFSFVVFHTEYIWRVSSKLAELNGIVSRVLIETIPNNDM